MFKIISIENIEEWDNVIEAFNKADIYYSSNYARVIKSNNEGEPLLIHYKNNNVEAINVVIKTDVSEYNLLKGNIEKNLYFDYSTPYGYGGILFKDNYDKETKNNIINLYISYSKKNNILTEFVRFHPVLENYSDLNTFEIIDLGPTVTIDTSNYDEAWLNYHSKNRNLIRKAKTLDVEVFYNNTKELVDDFKELYIETMDRLSAEKYYYFSESYFDELHKSMNGNYLVFYAKYDNKKIAMAYVMFSNNIMHYHLSATDSNYRNVPATNLLIDQIIKYASENGYDKLHLGGGLGSSKDGLYRFKKNFTKDESTRYKIGKTVFNIEKYKELSANIKKETNYFPKYKIKE